MQVLLGIAFVCLVITIFAIVGINKKNAISELELLKGKTNLKKLTSQGRKNKLIAMFSDMQTAMKATGQITGVYTIFLLSFMLIFVGIFSGISFDNIFLAPVLAIIFAALPFIYVRFQYINYKTTLFETLKTSLSVVSSSYERCENILQAFKENVDIVDEPLRAVFKGFIFDIEHNGVNTENAIKSMKCKISNDIFNLWCDCLIDCSKDRNQKARLYPISERMGVLKAKTLDAQNVLYAALSDFKGVAAFSAAFMFLSYYFIPTSLVAFQVKSSVLDFAFALDLLILLFFLLRATLLTKDITLDTKNAEGGN